MDFKKACEIMGMTSYKFTHKELKQKYYKMALKYHPDHNHDDPSSTARFQELYSAYEYLCDYMNIIRTDVEEEEVNTSDDYASLFKKFLSSEYNINIDTTTIVGDILKGCKMASFKIFENLDKKTALNVFNYMEEYSDIVGIDDTVKTDLKNILRDKIKDDECVVLHATLDNLFNADIYKLSYSDNDNYDNENANTSANDDTLTLFYVPLWHDEVTYELTKKDKLLVVKCIPDLPEHIKIDQFNHLHVYINVCSSTLFKRETIPVTICNGRVFEIPVAELHIVKQQVYTFYRMGIPMIHTENMFSTEKRGNVCVHVSINTF
jgi:hypothetical protein